MQNYCKKCNFIGNNGNNGKLKLEKIGKIGKRKKNVKKSNLMLYISRKTIFKRFSFMTCINMSL